MDVIELVAADHDEAAQLIDRLERIARDDARTSDAMRLVAQLAISMKTHARAEERVLYEALRTQPDALACLALEGPYEHQVVDVMLDKLAVQRPGPELAAILRVIRRLFEHHARRHEEVDVLPALIVVFSADERAQLGRDFLAEKRRIQPAIERLVGAPARGTHDGRHPHFHVHMHRR